MAKTVHFSIRLSNQSARLLRHWAHRDRVSRAKIIDDLILKERKRRGHSLKSIAEVSA